MIVAGDMDKIKRQVYENMTNAYITCTTGRWEISVPYDGTTYYETYADLMAEINANLDIMRELVEAGQIEREIWDAAWRNLS